MSCSTVTGSVNVTLAVSMAKLTLAVTPSMRLSRFSIRAEHELQVIPPTTRSTEVSIVGLTGVVVTMPLRASGRCRWRTPRRRRGRGARSRPPDGRARRSPRDPDQLVAGLVDCGPQGLQAGLLLCDHVDLAALEVHHHAPHTGDPTDLCGNGADAVGAGHPGHRVGPPRTHCGLLSLGPCRQPGRRCKRRYGSTVRQRQGPAVGMDPGTGDRNECEVDLLGDRDDLRPLHPLRYRRGRSDPRCAGRGGAPQARRGRRDRRAAAQLGVRAGRSRRGRLRAGRGRAVTGALGRLADYSVLLVLVFAVAYAIGTALKP